MDSTKDQLIVHQEFKLPNGDIVTIYRELMWGHFITIVTNKNNETAAVSTNH